MMRITDVVWTPEVNMLEIWCDVCETHGIYRSDRWKVRCRECGAIEHLNIIRERYVKQDFDL
jgi:hypothetical protein